jgi:hypothetical protein
MLILSRTFDLLTWLLPHTQKFPKAYRFGVTQRLESALLDFHEAIQRANVVSGVPRLEALRVGDASLATLRMYLRLALCWRWLSLGQHEHVSKIVEENGRLLGGWIAQTTRALARDAPIV